MIQTHVRNADLSDLAAMLQEQHVRKVDMVVPASALRSVEGEVQVSGVEPIMDTDGVTDPNGLYVPTSVFDSGLSARLDIPPAYIKRMRDGRPDLIDANVNGWLHGARELWSGPALEGGTVIRDAIPGDKRKFLLRTFRGDDDDKGIARALLSNQYAIVDNLDVLMATLDVLREMGVNGKIDRCSLTETRMTVDVVVPEISVLAETLLAGYRNPFGADFDRWRMIADREGLGYGGNEPVVWAGFRISNSETGGGAHTIVPAMKIKVCANGLVITKDAVRAVHLGGRLEPGVINWSEDTQQKNLDLIVSKTRDAVSTFLDVDYMARTIADIEGKADKEVTSDEVKVIAKRAKYTEAQQNSILDYFIRGGQTTRGGIMQAATAASQMEKDADVAYDMESKALTLLTA
jgi:hypothetical protein